MEKGSGQGRTYMISKLCGTDKKSCGDIRKASDMTRICMYKETKRVTHEETYITE